MSEQKPAGSSMRERLLFLSDGVFAIAITLLVLEIALPHITGNYQAQEQEFPGALWGLWPQILTYALTFMIVGVYWVSHQRVFEYLVRADSVLAWLNIAFLMSVAFLPIPSNILGEYGAHGAAVRFYALSLMVPGLLIIALWEYATHQHRLVEKDLAADIIRHRLERYAIAPVVFLIAIGLSYLNPHIAGVSLLLVVVGVLVHEIWHRLRVARGTNAAGHLPMADDTRSPAEDMSRDTSNIETVYSDYGETRETRESGT
jgi:uncharacterized membrane protein